MPLSSDFRDTSAVAAAILLLTAATPASEQEPFRHEQAWALAGPCCGDSGHDIAVEPDGSFFIVGRYGALDLDGDGAVDQRSEGGHDAIIMKGRPAGDLAWVRAPRSPKASYGLLKVAPDRHGGAYVAGSFIDSLQFRTGERITGRGPLEGFVARYSAAGDPLWARAIGGTGTDRVADVASDATGNVYVVGAVQGSVDLNSDARPDATVAGKNGQLVASFDASGALRWAKVSDGKGEVAAEAIAVGPDGVVHVAGHYTGADVDLDADGRVDLPVTRAGSAPFIARFEAGGRLARAVALTGAGASRIRKLALAVDGELIAAGYTQGSLDLDGDGKADVENIATKETPYVARFHRDGSVAWVRSFRQQERLSILDVAASADRIAVSGIFDRRLDLNGDGRPDVTGDPDGLSEGFVALLDNDGATRQILSITGPGHDQPRAAAFAADGRSLSLTGFVRLTADFDGDGVPEGGVKCDNYGDIIFARYHLKK